MKWKNMSMDELDETLNSLKQVSAAQSMASTLKPLGSESLKF